MCLCMSLASDSSETIEVIIIKLGTVTALTMVMHHVLIILTLTFIQGHTDLNHENNKCSIISETDQSSKPHQVCCEDSPTKGILFFQSNNLALHSRSQLHLKLDKCSTCSKTAIPRTVFKLWHSN